MMMAQETQGELYQSQNLCQKTIFHEKKREKSYGFKEETGQFKMTGKQIQRVAAIANSLKKIYSPFWIYFLDYFFL